MSAVHAALKLPVHWQSSLRLFIFSVAVAFAGLVTSAEAHPHVWVTMNTELLYKPDGSVTGLRQAWTFDDGFSAYATMGLAAKTKGQFTREELQPLAQTNVEGLKDYAYFTYAWIDGKRQRNAFTDPIDYWATYDAQATVLTLHFTLPFKTPVKAKVLRIEIYDPEFFVDLGFAEENPVELVDAPSKCKVSTDKPYDGSFPSTQTSQSLSQFFTSEVNAGMGMNFANKIIVQCP